MIYQELKRLFAILLALSVGLTVASPALASSPNHSSPPEGKQIPVADDTWKPPQLGTIPLPESKVVHFPAPDGPSTIVLNFPDQVTAGEPFTISATFQTQAPPDGDPSWWPDWNWLCFLMQLYLPAGVTAPTDWTEESLTPWGSDSATSSGAVELWPSVDAIAGNWWGFWGVAVAPYLDGNLIVASERHWRMGHYVWMWDGDTVTWTFDHFVIAEPGVYEFELLPYPGADHTFQGPGLCWDALNDYYYLDSVSFKIMAGPIPATVDVKPESFNLRSNGTFTAYIEIPGYNLAGIDISSIRINGTGVQTSQTEIGDYDVDGIPDLMVKFPRSCLGSLAPGQAMITVTGNVGTRHFSGDDSIRVL